MTITYTAAQVVRMTAEQIDKLGMLCPKFVYYQMETSGSPSAWTECGEYLVGTKGSDIVRCAKEICTMHESCADYNAACGRFDNRKDYTAHIRVIF